MIKIMYTLADLSTCNFYAVKPIPRLGFTPKSLNQKTTLFLFKTDDGGIKKT
jgi:hypothetical protein